MTLTAYASDTDHFAPGVPNIRDLAVPEPGFYGAVYNYSYLTDQLNDANGNQISSVTLTGPNGRSVTLHVGVNVHAYALAPMFIWVSHKKILGAKYGAYISPSFTNASLDALLSAAENAGRSAKTGNFSVGDIFVQPVWLGWTGKHYDASYGYGFYIPSGQYHITTVNLPALDTTVRVASPNNSGLGYWTNQNQGALYLYPWADRRMAIQNALTWEINQQKRGFALTPGQHLSWNWGISQFLPIKKDQSLLLEAGPAGYSSFQVTSDSGADASVGGVKDHVNAVGVQLGITLPKRNMVLNFHWFHEYDSVDRFQGNSLGLSFIAKLSKKE